MNKEITIKSEKIFEGKIINLRIDTVELENQKYAKREIVEHKGAVAMLAINNDDEMVIVKQYRKAVEEFLLEIPAGKIELGEEPKECALRELTEETGYIAGKIEKLFEVYSSPGCSNEKIYIYKAEDLTCGQTNFDEDEFIEVMTLSKEEAKKMLDSGRIVDGKTLICILYWLNS